MAGEVARMVSCVFFEDRNMVRRLSLLSRWYLSTWIVMLVKTHGCFVVVCRR